MMHEQSISVANKKMEGSSEEAASLAGSGGSGRRMQRSDWEKKLFRTLVVVNLASILEKADEVVLFSVYREIGLSLHASPTRLAALTLLQRIVQTLCSPLAAYLSVRHDRAGVIALGAMLWAIATFAVGASSTFVQVAVSRALTGIGLAMVLPAIQSLVADAADPKKRGLAFGWLQFTGNLGAMLGTVPAVLLAGTTVFGIDGWRVFFHIIAAASVVVAFLVYLLGIDPRFKEDPRGHSTYDYTSSALAETLVGAKTVTKIPTFIALVAQGAVGSFSWAALSFGTMWLELIGFSHSTTAALSGSYVLSLSLGGLFGGWVGDAFAQYLPNTGRIMLAQFSAGMSALAGVVFYLFLPYDSSTAVLHGAVFFAMGFLMPWSATVANNPIFSEIVPKNLRTSVYALDQSFESLFASFAPLLVGILAEHVFGYVSPSDDASIVADIQNAAALGKALLVGFGIPCSCCCLLYSVLYWTYPKDRDKAKPKEELHYSDEDGSLGITGFQDLNPYVSLSEDGAHIEKARDTY